ncbi:MAG: dihydropteroate synthase [Actinomycetota bacterium]
MNDGPAPTLLIKGRARTIDSTLVMGVVNASPESFSDGGRHTTFDAQVRLAASLVEAGADIIDVGGQSAVTNQPPIEEGLEVDRVLPIVEWLVREFPDVLVSVDTYKQRVVDAVLQAGAHIINDVSGLRYPAVAASCAQHGASLVIMHTAAPPKVRLQDPALYADVTAEVVGFLQERMDVAIAAGVPCEALILDPGPDFTKTPYQTVEMLRRIDEVRALGRPLLLALSRKDFLGAITHRTPRQRDAATAAAIAHPAVTPGNIVRVHDVAAAVDVIATIDVLVGRRDLEPDFVLPDSLRYEKPHE